MNCLTITNLVCAFDALDKNGNCMSLETFDFSPKEVLKLITIDDYILFLTYSLGNVCIFDFNDIYIYLIKCDHFLSKSSSP